ncbi:hypothetical protein HNW77_07765 [Komagataeibacter sp. AV436]|uniref:Uncharacterized protein n=1 Tax=Komagataeibacter melomenusus TaxID=2766578 RepID=A0ABX2ADE2_9PROT|nr:hypothetical protein [Komagataeibacter melomenusus]MBV1830657.1 hypothetical protein [Komagataeibacter melomenusus]NPC66285.1 hypothetical protein [Komagataeibacter melomenusus]
MHDHEQYIFGLFNAQWWYERPSYLALLLVSMLIVWLSSAYLLNLAIYNITFNSEEEEKKKKKKDDGDKTFGALILSGVAFLYDHGLAYFLMFLLMGAIGPFVLVIPAVLMAVSSYWRSNDKATGATPE